MKTIYLDVRTREEYNSGHIPDAINIDYYQLDFETQIQQLAKNQTYIVYCRTGVRSLQACAIMLKLGFSRVKNLEGGYEQWVA